MKQFVLNEDNLRKGWSGASEFWFSRQDMQMHSMAELADFCAVNHVGIGIVTVPKEAAQAATDVLYRSGVRAFWCFAPCRLQLPPDAVIQYENLALSLAHLKARL